MSDNTIWVVFTKDDTWLSRVIQWVTRGRMSHALLLWEDPRLGWLRMEADWDGYHIRPSQHGPGAAFVLKGRRLASNWVAIPIAQEGILAHCAKHLGRPYDYPGALGFLAVALGRLLKKAWKNPLQHPSAMFCSEAIAEGLKEAGHSRFQTLDPGTASPQDVMDRLLVGRQVVWVR